MTDPTYEEQAKLIEELQEQLANSMPVDPRAKLANMSWQRSAARWFDKYSDKAKDLIAAQEQVRIYAERMELILDNARNVTRDCYQEGKIHCAACARSLGLIEELATSNPPDGASALSKVAKLRGQYQDLVGVCQQILRDGVDEYMLGGLEDARAALGERSTSEGEGS